MSDKNEDKLQKITQKYLTKKKSRPKVIESAKKVVGKYFLKKEIGRGAFATVYKGKNRETDEAVAIKMIARKKLSDKLNLALNKEIDILKSITNPNIIRFHDVQKTNSNIYLILEYCSGGDLRQYLNERGRIEEFEVQKLIYHLSNGFKVFHERNIVHRDLKLSNLLLSSKEPNAVIKICDFGFARTVLESEEAKTFCGTPPNMAPEVLSNLAYNEKADLWSIGTIIFELLIGTSPFGSNPIQVLNNIKRGVYKIPGYLKISNTFFSLLNGLLQYDPNKRYGWEEYFNHVFVKTPPDEYLDNLKVLWGKEYGRETSTIMSRKKKDVHFGTSTASTKDREEVVLSENIYSSGFSSTVTEGPAPVFNPNTNDTDGLFKKEIKEKEEKEKDYFNQKIKEERVKDREREKEEFKKNFPLDKKFSDKKRINKIEEKGTGKEKKVEDEFEIIQKYNPFLLEDDTSTSNIKFYNSDESSMVSQANLRDTKLITQNIVKQTTFQKENEKDAKEEREEKEEEDLKRGIEKVLETIENTISKCEIIVELLEENNKSHYLNKYETQIFLLLFTFAEELKTLITLFIPKYSQASQTQDTPAHTMPNPLKPLTSPQAQAHILERNTILRLFDSSSTDSQEIIPITPSLQSHIASRTQISTALLNTYLTISTALLKYQYAQSDINTQYSLTHFFQYSTALANDAALNEFLFDYNKASNKYRQAILILELIFRIHYQIINMSNPKLCAMDELKFNNQESGSLNGNGIGLGGERERYAGDQEINLNVSVEVRESKKENEIDPGCMNFGLFEQKNHAQKEDKVNERAACAISEENLSILKEYKNDLYARLEYVNKKDKIHNS